ncbi:hypothetical protein BD770DRAFT_444058 [Pilaira anomala]|nr:hypothetical protein BD770DRAFT_444058 [Pilaira anomala]
MSPSNNRSSCPYSSDFHHNNNICLNNIKTTTLYSDQSTTTPVTHKSRIPTPPSPSLPVSPPPPPSPSLQVPPPSLLSNDIRPPTQAQIDIVRYTWERVSEIRLVTDDPNVSSSHAFGLAFYEALFELDPSLKPLFTNIFQQARALAGMVSYIARAPNVTGGGGNTNKLARPASTSSSCGFSPTTDKIPTIREINAHKRKENHSLSFSELVANTVANANSVTLDEMDTDRLLYKLRELGSRHYFYNVQGHQLSLVGPAILTAIQVRLGKDDYLPEVAEAWTRAHAFAAYHMRIGLEAQSNWESGKRKSNTKLSSSLSHNTKSNCVIQ